MYRFIFQSLLVTLLVGWMAPTVWGETTQLSADAKNKIIEEVKKAADKLDQAFNDKDIPAIKGLCTPDHLSVTLYQPKPKGLAEAFRLLEDYKTSAYTRMNVTVKPLNANTALLNMTVRVKSTFRGKPMPSRYFASGVWVKRDGKWLEAFYQETPLTDQ